ncbi:unnamed protein product [Mytilus coruscus]|uniref:HARBI1 n=1 Tax=Mytilus coruscus TaxID=42192 RepID=A0A6J8AL78_MYTCO|nr:unnamed protein product [Mytilus coruscus]
MNRQCIMEVIDLIRYDISHKTMRSFAISPEQQTFAALRFYATGSFQQVTGDIIKVLILHLGIAYDNNKLEMTLDLQMMHLTLLRLGGAITIELRNAIKAIVATGVLHNICEKKGIPLPNEELINTDYEGNDEMYDNGEIVEDGEVFQSRLMRERF